MYADDSRRFGRGVQLGLESPTVGLQDGSSFGAPFNHPEFAARARWRLPPTRSSSSQPSAEPRRVDTTQFKKAGVARLTAQTGPDRRLTHKAGGERRSCYLS